ncbi:hypothetical protein Bca4012_065966 [Brassica carinata]
MVEEETPTKLQTAWRMNQLNILDPCDFRRTLLSTFLISPFVWNKTREMELSRHELGPKNVVFEPVGELWKHRNKLILIEEKSAETTIDFGNPSTSGNKVLHVSAQQEPDNAANDHLIIKTLSILQNISVWINSKIYLYLIVMEGCKTYSWRPGAYVSVLIILRECSARARISWGHKKLEAEQHALILNYIKIWKPPVMQQLQYHCR